MLLCNDSVPMDVPLTHSKFQFITRELGVLLDSSHCLHLTLKISINHVGISCFAL